MRTKKIFIIIRKEHLKTIFYITSFLVIILLSVIFINYNKVNDQNDSQSITYIKNPDNENFYPASVRPHKPKLAIIIDDFGGLNRDGVKEMMEIDRHLTLAIMPFLSFSKQDAIKAHKRGYEVIVHLPMQSQNEDIASWLGPRPVKLNLSDAAIKKTVLDSINSIPYAVGVNIHMGVLASENERVMSCVMKAVKEKNFYFVDSLTSPRTVCRSVAKKIGVKFAKRNVFLEKPSSKTKSYIKKQLAIAGDLALKNGQAVVIGHVGSAGGKVTAEAIKEMIPILESKGIRLVFISELLK